MKLITQCHLVLGLRMSRAIPLLPMYAFMAHTVTDSFILTLTDFLDSDRLSAILNGIQCFGNSAYFQSVEQCAEYILSF